MPTIPIYRQWYPHAGIVEVGGERLGFGPRVKFWKVHGPHQIDVSDGARWKSFRLCDIERIEAEGEADVRRIVDQPEPMPIPAPAPAPPPAEAPTQRGPYAAETITTPRSNPRMLDPQQKEFLTLLAIFAFAWLLGRLPRWFPDETPRLNPLDPPEGSDDEPERGGIC